MHESFEFRIVEDFASRLFAPTEGKRLGLVRRVTLDADDARLARVGELQRAINAESGRAFFHGWRIRRRYDQGELETASLFQIESDSAFEPAGEECGTIYDESSACPLCGSGASQASPLILDLRRAPRGKEIASTIADELIVSQSLAQRLIGASLSGFELRPVRHKGRHTDDAVDLKQTPSGRAILQAAEAAGAPYPTGKFHVWLNRQDNRPLWERALAEHAALAIASEDACGKSRPAWYQLVASNSMVEVVPPTVVGTAPFDLDEAGRCRCARGDLIGLNVLSEVTIDAATRGAEDVCLSRQFVGVRRGLLRPRRLLFVSQKFLGVLRSEGRPRGVRISVVRLTT